PAARAPVQLLHDNKHVKQVEGRPRAGQSWDEDAWHVFSQSYGTIEELEETKACDFDKQALSRAAPDVSISKPEDDMPLDDDFFTRVCDKAVRPLALGTVSDDVQCSHCFARFHG
ncbi:hypothetical protein FA95DRAFT_1613376, partial [Auriscalpium vulgare]